METPRDQKVTFGGQVALVCRATGNPSPEVYWRRRGRRLTTTRIRYTIVEVAGGSMLRMERVKSQHAGAVECVADNGVGGTTSASANIEVYAQGVGRSVWVSSWSTNFYLFVWPSIMSQMCVYGVMFQLAFCGMHFS
jgi:hypothetical protein